MAGENRTTAHALISALAEAPHAYGFFQALRRMECAWPERPRLAESRRAADDPIRLAQDPHLIFAPSTFSTCTPGAGGKPPRLASYFLGLFGPNGPLPLHLTEYARERARNFDDPTFIAFADLFHHRMLSLFYRAWANAQPTVSFDRPDEDRFSTYIGSLIGRGTESMHERDAMPDSAKLFYAGRFALDTRNAEGLRAMLKDFFHIPVEIDEFIGHWMEIPHDGRCRLGEAPLTGSLGESAVIGSHKWEGQQKFRILFGPLDLADYERLLPGGNTLTRLVALVRNYIGDELTWDVNLILKREQLPAVRLGQSGQLGWTTWLTSDAPEHDPADLLLTPLDYGRVVGA